LFAGRHALPRNRTARHAGLFSATASRDFLGYAGVVGDVHDRELVDRHNFEGWKPNDWIGAELYTLPLGICAVLAGWGKPRWLQWIGVAGMLAQNLGFFVFYTLGS
jgi:hypothetical protein